MPYRAWSNESLAITCRARLIRSNQQCSKTALRTSSNVGCCGGGLRAGRWLGTPLGVNGGDVGGDEGAELFVARVVERGEAHRLVGDGGLEQVAHEAGVAEAAAT